MSSYTLGLLSSYCFSCLLILPLIKNHSIDGYRRRGLMETRIVAFLSIFFFLLLCLRVLLIIKKLEKQYIYKEEQLIILHYTVHWVN